ncbi:MAG: cobalamin-binding protein [Proteobacteria bacterium]|nr:cobalamin-binding protein [Pseudomonadota bacterium]
MELIIEKIFQAVIEGSVPNIEASVKEALETGTPPENILNQGLIAAMDEVGQRFEAGEYFVPEMLIAGRAMKTGIALLRPLLAETGIEPIGKAVIGTVKGDLHDIGKNLVGLMLEGAGFEVIDAGADVSPEDFVAAVTKESPDILGMSALLTTTMTNAADVVKLLEENGMRDKVKVMFGGAPVTQEYVDQIGGDGYAPDAASAAKKAKELCGI